MQGGQAARQGALGTGLGHLFPAITLRSIRIASFCERLGNSPIDTAWNTFQALWTEPLPSLELLLQH